MRALILVLLFGIPVSAQIPMGGITSSGVAKTFTLNQVSNWQTCSTSPCTLTISIPAGDAVLIACASSNAMTCTGASGDGGTWTTENTNGTGCAINTSAGAHMSCVYNLQTAAIISTLTTTLSTNAALKYKVWDYSYTGTAARDTSGAASSNASGGLIAGVSLTLGGSQDVIVQWIQDPGANVTAISSPYNQFSATGGIAAAQSINTISGTAPNWSGTGNNNGVSAFAFKLS